MKVNGTLVALEALVGNYQELREGRRLRLRAAALRTKILDREDRRLPLRDLSGAHDVMEVLFAIEGISL